MKAKSKEARNINISKLKVGLRPLSAKWIGAKGNPNPSPHPSPDPNTHPKTGRERWSDTNSALYTLKTLDMELTRSLARRAFMNDGAGNLFDSHWENVMVRARSQANNDNAVGIVTGM